MLWSIPIARIAGTVVRVHVTFLLFIVWIGGAYWRQGGREAAYGATVSSDTAGRLAERIGSVKE